MDRPPALGVLHERNNGRRAQGLERRLVSMGSRAMVDVEVDGRPAILMCSNDYLGLSHHPRLAEEAVEACLTQGAGSGASRLISGTLDAHLALERQIAAFKRAQAALFFCTGYMANLSAVTSLAGRGDYIVSDRLNHASLIDACRLSRAEVAVYDHGDAAQAERLLAARPEAPVKLVVTDGVFSMDGDLAPLPELLAACRRHNALLVVDDAHATGVWGERGRGTAEHFGLEGAPELVMVGTMSKALGGLGGFVAGRQEVVTALVNGARPFIYTTSPPPAQVAAAAAALRLIDDEPNLRVKLWELSKVFRRGVAALGLRLASEQGPIAPVLTGETEPTLALGQALLARGIYAPAIRPPTVPAGACRIRFAISALHCRDHVLKAVEALGQAAREVGL